LVFKNLLGGKLKDIGFWEAILTDRPEKVFIGIEYA
jgi:hypothetical protein